MAGCRIQQMKIEISNQQQRYRIPKAPLKKFAQWIMQRVQALNSRCTWSELSVVLMDDQGIARLNETHLGAHRPTDVISFAYPAIPGENDGYTGEIIVNVERAATAGPRYNGVSEELALYVAHGCHHLTGATDETPSQRARMRRVERRWLQEAGQSGLIKRLTVQPA